MAVPGLAQGSGEKGAPLQPPQLPLQKHRKVIPGPPDNLPYASPADKARGMDYLFGALKAAPDESSARHVEKRIWAVWSTSDSDAVMLLMTRAQAAAAARQYDLALRLLDVVVQLRPDFVEGWNRRATLHYLKNEYADALADLQQVLVREPRHFAALTGLGMVMNDLGEERRALEAFRRALAINPHLERVPDMVKTLSEKVEGRDI